MRITNAGYNKIYKYNTEKSSVAFRGDINTRPKYISHKDDICIGGKAIQKKKLTKGGIAILAPVLVALSLIFGNPAKEEDKVQDTIVSDYDDTDNKNSNKNNLKTETASLDSYNEYENIYTVKKGETLASITRQYLDENTDWKIIQKCVDKIAKDSNLTDDNAITPGAKINISFLNEMVLLRKGKYIIKDGDTLSSVVRKFAGNDISWEEVEGYVIKLLELNPSIKEADSIKPNQKINISVLTSDKTFEELVACYDTQGEDDTANTNNNIQQPSNTIATKNETSFSQTEKEKTSGVVKFKSFERSTDESVIKTMATANVQEFIPVKKGELSGKTIMVNAGHGGVNPDNMLFDGGAHNGDEEEYTYAAEYVQTLAQKLLDKGAKVVILQGAVEVLPSPIINFAKENADNIDNTAFISLHFDAFEDKSIKGTSVFYQGNKASRPFARNLYNSMEDAGINFIHNQPIEKNLQVTRTATSDECGIKNAALVECGTISNSKDLKNIKSETYKDKLTDSLVKGIINSF